MPRKFQYHTLPILSTQPLRSLIQPHARAFEEACKLDKAHILNFAEEVIRGQPFFILSMLLRKLGPKLREAAGLGLWQIVSVPSSESVTGKLVALPDLSSIQGRSMSEPTVIVAESLSGNEDIPVCCALGRNGCWELIIVRHATMLCNGSPAHTP